MKIGFIGCGNMGGALATAVNNANIQKTLYLLDKNEELQNGLATKLNANTAALKEIIDSANYVFIGVKPQVASIVASEINECLSSSNNNPVFISMMAGINTTKLENLLSNSAKIIRIMPNTPVSVNKGMILYCTNRNVTQAEEDNFVKMLEESSVLSKLDESLIDAGCAVSGCGPAFVYMFIDALAKGGEKSGLTYDEALVYATQTVIGASTLLQTSNKTPEELKNAVCSPNGSTIEGVKSLEENSFYNVVINAVEKSFIRTKELGK
ncbi:MAG: pyrroline-5-carboxylate reductase [Clostridia bacterium]|nr:pyrroline-5-carboxylate reductase [Clostridia bacterium]